MKIVEERVFRIPIDEIRSVLESRYNVDLTGVEPFLDKDSIAFSIRLEDVDAKSSATEPATGAVAATRPRSRRRRRKRNRIKTRGWPVIAKITNSKGLVANVYKPLVSALQGREIPRSEQRKIVRQLLIENGNSPSPDSVEYFLDNTREYLSGKAQRIEVTA